MNPLWLTVAAFCAAFGGFAALSLAMDRHYAQCHGRGITPPTQRRWLRLAGTTGLTLSLLSCLLRQGSSQGWVLWCGVLTASALGMVLVLAYTPRHVTRASWLASGIGVVALLRGMTSG